MNDAQLIEAYSKTRAEAAFRALVERHLPLVLGTARRITGDSGIAEETAQTVFILLARKASSLREGTVVPGWLYRTTCFVAQRALRTELRRRRREQEAVAMQTPNQSLPPAPELGHHLDNALQQLSSKERNAILLRFYEERSIPEVGASLGISEAAAKKRVTRGLEKLRQFFTRRGTQITSAALIAVLTQETAKAAVSAAIVSKVTATALAPAASSALLLDVLSAWRWAKIKLILGASSGVVAAALLISQTLPAAYRQPAAPTTNQSALAELPTNAPALPTATASPSTFESIDIAGQTLPAHALKITVLDAATGDPIAGAKVMHTLMWSANPTEPPPALRTDAKGTVVFAVPEYIPGGERMNQFQVSVRANGYASREIMWLCSTGSVFNIVTNDYTVRLENGVTIGGVVTDESGRPLEGARVGVFGNNYLGYSYSTDGSGKVTSPPTLRNEDFSSFSQSSEGADAIVTDQSGRFQFTHFPSDLKAVLLDLIGTDGARRKFKTLEGARLTADETEPVSFRSLQTGSARLLLPRGVTVAGAVVDQFGQPVAGATVSEGTQWGNLRILSSVETGYSGQFWLSNRPPREIILAASADGYASASTIVAVKPGMGITQIQLPPELPLKGRIVNQDGEAVTGAMLRLSDIDNEGLGLKWDGTTDGEGRFAWRSAPTNQVAIYVAAAGYPARLVRLRSATNELVVRLNANGVNNAAYVTGTVADATSGKPVEHFMVKVRHDHWSDWETGPTFAGLQGAFSLTTSPSEVPVGTLARWFLTIEAPGYEPYQTGMFNYEEGDQTFDIKLQPGGSVEGIVRNPAGDLASDCLIAVVTENDKPNSSNPGKFTLYGNSDGTTHTDTAGYFKLREPLNLEALVAFGKNGWATAKIGTNHQTLDLQLLPWGHIAGTLMKGDTAVTNETIALDDLVSDPANPIQMMQRTQTDAEGRFAFDNVPAGQYRVSVESRPWQHTGRDVVETMQTAVDVSAGATNEVLLKESGQVLVAKLAMARSIAAVDWSDCQAILNRDVSVPPPPSRANFVSESSYMAARSNYSSDPAVLAGRRAMRSYWGSVSKDGSVTFENVPAGNYLLDIKLFSDGRLSTSSPTGSQNVSTFISTTPTVIDQLNIPVTVPEQAIETTNAVPLGTFTLDNL
jgi:RNA polymerase sigma factor (sigma-70 family)